VVWYDRFRKEANMPKDHESRVRVTLFIDEQIVRQAKAASALTSSTLSDVVTAAFIDFAASATQESATPATTPR